jgi:hypothetical protein
VAIGGGGGDAAGTVAGNGGDVSTALIAFLTSSTEEVSYACRAVLKSSLLLYFDLVNVIRSSFFSLFAL